VTTRAGVGMSRHHNPNIAGREAAEQALKKAGVDRPDFVFMFASIGYDQRSLLRAVRETTGGAPLTGCSAEGTIDEDNADESNFSVVVTAISSRNCSPTYLLTPLACSSSRMGAVTSALQWATLMSYLQGWKKTSRASGSSHCGAGELTTTSIWGSQPFNTATTKSSLVGSPTRCSRARHTLVGPSATAVSQ
jgi:hypothetical protein